MSTLKLSKDTKVQFYKDQENSFGLLPGVPKDGGTCPFATHGSGGCLEVRHGRNTRTCYVERLSRFRKEVEPLLKYNTELLRNKTCEEQTEVLSKAFLSFYMSEIEQDKPQPYFRIHWSGDIFDYTYAEALKKAITAIPQVKFWIYTRTFPCVSIFKDIDNLTCYISLDSQNIYAGLQCYFENQFAKIAYMHQTNNFSTYIENSSLSNIKLIECPADSKKIKSEFACSICKNCINGANHVYFKTK